MRLCSSGRAGCELEEGGWELEFELEKSGQPEKLRGEFGFWLKNKSRKADWPGQGANVLFCVLVSQ